MIELTWADVDDRLEAMKLTGLKVWGIPRGGAITAGLARRHGAVVVGTPQEAEFALDDVIDSGATAVAIKAQYGLQTLAVVDKMAEGIDSWVHFPWEEPPETEMADHVTRMMQYWGEDTGRDGLIKTPERVVRSWEELYAGYKLNGEDVLTWFEDDTDEMIVVKNITFYSTCEHHLLPFFGTINVGYIPNGSILGASKVGRVAHVYSRRLQVQERLARQIGQSLEAHVLGVAVNIQAQHFCMMARGINQDTSRLVTNYLTGYFRDRPDTRAEFFTAISG